MTAQTYYAMTGATQNTGTTTQTDSDSDCDNEGLIYQAYETDPRDNYLYPFLNTFSNSQRETGNDDDNYDDGNETTTLSLRGELIEITKRELGQLPDYVIISLSNSIVLPDDSDDNYEVGDYPETSTDIDLETDPPMMVDYSPASLRYTLNFFRHVAATSHLPASSLPAAAGSIAQVPSPLPVSQPAVLLLREELEYYCIPKKPNLSPKTFNYIKHECGLLLQETDNVFSGFRDCDDDKEALATVSKTVLLEDAHVRAVLARNGIGSDAIWGVREMEPGRTMITSLLLVELENGDNGHDSVKQANESVSTTINSENTTKAADQSIANDSKSSVTISNISGDGGRSDRKIQETATLLDNIEKEYDEDTFKDGNDSIYKPHDSSIPYTEYDDRQNIRNSNYADAEEDSDEGNDEDDVESVSFLPLVAATDLMEFRYKPARRCWWTKFTVEDVDGYGDVTLHVRKVWVLELCNV